MNDTVIEIENLSKRYRLGLIGRTALHEDLSRWWARLRGRPDPTLKVTEANDPAAPAHAGHVWALRDVSFSLRRGEVLGIIGRNGAGKSTLLKILSRVTAPTEGVARIRGRVGSLLEVGTGFHPELTGRENAFLNGSILGMTRAEVVARLDSIVEFSGCARFIDTPVKRYSSGMLVRLGFAVAAHLDADILIVDEVLAVGDVEFQRRCLGKMQDVAGSGRTVLFVSHNMGMVDRLCSRCVLLDRGRSIADGMPADVIRQYFGMGAEALTPAAFRGQLAQRIRVREVGINDEFGRGLYLVRPSEPLSFTIRGESLMDVHDFRFLAALFASGVRLLTAHDAPDFTPLRRGPFEARITLPPYVLRPGEYSLAVGGMRSGTEGFFGPDLARIRVLEVWDAACDAHAPGLLNLPPAQIAGERHQPAAAEKTA